MGRGTFTDRDSMPEVSLSLPDDDGQGIGDAQPLSSIPGVTETVTESAWRSAVLPVLTTTVGMACWETSERCTAWLSACHINLGIAGS